jgi:hypothetical protein
VNSSVQTDDDSAARQETQSIIALLKPYEHESWPVAFLIAQMSGQPLPPKSRLYTAVEMFTDVIGILKPHIESVPAAGVLVECMERELKTCWIPPGMLGRA